MVNLSLACSFYTPIDQLPQEKNAFHSHLTEADKLTTGRETRYLSRLAMGKMGQAFRLASQSPQVGVSAGDPSVSALQPLTFIRRRATSEWPFIRVRPESIGKPSATSQNLLPRTLSRGLEGTSPTCWLLGRSVWTWYTGPRPLLWLRI